MNRGLQSYRIRKALQKKGVASDLVDVEALIDGKLTYSENKRSIVNVFGGNKTVDGSKRSADYYASASQAHARRSPRAKQIDEKRNARKQFDGESLNKKEYRAWSKNPNRYDITGIDEKSTFEYVDDFKPIKRYGPGRGFF